MAICAFFFCPQKTHLEGNWTVCHLSAAVKYFLVAIDTGWITDSSCLSKNIYSDTMYILCRQKQKSHFSQPTTSLTAWWVLFQMKYFFHKVDDGFIAAISSYTTGTNDGSLAHDDHRMEYLLCNALCQLVSLFGWSHESTFKSVLWNIGSHNIRPLDVGMSAKVGRSEPQLADLEFSTWSLWLSQKQFCRRLGSNSSFSSGQHFVCFCAPFWHLCKLSLRKHRTPTNLTCFLFQILDSEVKFCFELKSCHVKQNELQPVVANRRKSTKRQGGLPYFWVKWAVCKCHNDSEAPLFLLASRDFFFTSKQRSTMPREAARRPACCVGTSLPHASSAPMSTCAIEFLWG